MAENGGCVVRPEGCVPLDDPIRAVTAATSGATRATPTGWLRSRAGIAARGGIRGDVVHARTVRHPGQSAPRTVSATPSRGRCVAGIGGFAQGALLDCCDDLTGVVPELVVHRECRVLHDVRERLLQRGHAEKLAV